MVLNDYISYSKVASDDTKSMEVSELVIVWIPAHKGRCVW